MKFIKGIFWSLTGFSMLALASGTALAQPSLSGDATVSFGQYSKDIKTPDPDSTATVIPLKKSSSGSGFISTAEANLVWTGEEGPFDYYVRLRLKAKNGPGESGGNPVDTSRIRLRWNLSPVFSISMGDLPGIGGTGTAGVNQGADYAIGTGDNGLEAVEAGTMDFKYSTDMVTAGLAISTKCELGCNGYDSSEMSMLPYVMANIAGVKANFRMAMDSADTNAGTSPASVSNSGMQLEFGYGFGPVSFGLEYQTRETNEVTKGVVSGVGKDAVYRGKKLADEKTSIVIGVKFDTGSGTAYFGYNTTTEDNGEAAGIDAIKATVDAYKAPKASTKDEDEVTTLMIGYLHNLADNVAIGGQFASRNREDNNAAVSGTTTKKVKVGETDETEIRFVTKVSF